VPNPRAPAQVFEEGVWVDYRYFMRQGIEPSYEFGFGMSYTRFLYSNLSIAVVENGTGGYKPTSGKTGPAPTYGVVNTTLEANVVPDGFEKVVPYVYPWVNESTFRLGYGAGSVGPAAASDGSAQPLLPAGGAPGGNPGLYDVVYTISFAINNTGPVFGTEIPQLVSFVLSFSDQIDDVLDERTDLCSTCNLAARRTRSVFCAGLTRSR
jgi:beta-glucosidase